MEQHESGVCYKATGNCAITSCVPFYLPGGRAEELISEALKSGPSIGFWIALGALPGQMIWRHLGFY